MIAAAALTVALLATWLAAFRVAPVEHADQAVFRGFGGLANRPHVDGVANFIAGLGNPQPYLYLCAVPVLVAVARRRLWLALAIVAILLGANVTTQLLKPLLAEPRAAGELGGLVPPQAASWPSGHATAAMSLALAMVLAAPARLRPRAAAAGAGFAIAVCYSFLTLGWHYPSDVLGGFLVAATWTLLGVGALLTSDRRRPREVIEEVGPEPLPLGAALAPIAVTLAAAAALACLIVLVRPHEVVDYAQAHKVFVVGAAAIGALGMALATGVMLAVRR